MTASIVGRTAFAALRADGRRFNDGPLRLRFLATDGPEPRVAFANGRRFGTAVDRNRARRRVKEAFRVSAGSSPPVPCGDYLFSSSREVLTCEFVELVQSIDHLFDRVEPAVVAAAPVAPPTAPEVVGR